LRLVRNNLVEAKEALRKLKIVLENCGSENLPSSQFLIQACKNFVEGAEYVSEIGVSIDEENLELNYLRAFALAKMGNVDEAKDVIQELLKKEELSVELKEACEEVLVSLS
jgi:predicted Zn-dependent protease